MRVTVLGAGTCVPDAARLPAGYWIEAGGAQIRLDAGPGTVHATTRYPHLDWQAQTHQLVSHFHLDHIGDLPMLLMAFKYGRQPAPRGPLGFVGPAGLRELLERFVALLGMRLLEQAFPVEFTALEDGDVRELGPEVRVRACRVPHTEESLAYRVETPRGSLAYTGDTSPEWERLPAFVRGADVLIAECSHPEPAGTPHLALDEVIRLAREARPRRLVTVHHYFDVEVHGLARRLADALPGVDTHVGHDGLTLTL